MQSIKTKKNTKLETQNLCSFAGFEDFKISRFVNLKMNLYLPKQHYNNAYLLIREN